MKKVISFLLLSFLSGINGMLVYAQPEPGFVKVPASSRYKKNYFLRNFLIGKNYRAEWGRPVTVPVFHLSQSGLTIKEMGGGMQTKSLKLEDSLGREWALRTVDKQARGAIPKPIRKTLAGVVVQEMISASYPYGALVVGELAQREGIVAPNPVLFYIPDDPAFGAYRQIFAQTLCFLEQKAPTPDNSKSKNTEDLIPKLQEENDHLVLPERVLQARLLDMLVADWDRHAGQWRWGKIDSGGFHYYYPIPRDRDQAFFLASGLLPRIAKSIALRHINGFKPKSTRLKALNYKTWGFDGLFENELSRQDWIRITKAFQAKLPDSAIIAAVRRLPREIFQKDSAFLVGRLISRRNTLLKGALKYYHFIASSVQVNGSDEREQFVLTGKGGQITVQVFRLTREGAVGSKIYERTFSPSETHFIYLDGRAGDDVFALAEEVHSRIKIRILGGKGADRYDLKGKGRTEVWDQEDEGNQIIHRTHARIHFR